MSPELAILPLVDEHHVLVSAPASVVWRQIGAVIGRQRRLGSRVAASLLGTEPRSASGDPLSRGATLPGFAVAGSVPGGRLVLTGRHRFSEYALTLTLTGQEHGTLLSARTNARFPGPHGRVYRALVIGSGAHRIVVTRLLHSVRRAAEAVSLRDR